MSATIYPTGVTIYNPEKCFNGYNIVPLATGGVLLFDMNGNEIRKWEMKGMPPQILPNGNIMGYSGRRSSKFSVQDGLNLMQIDYDGNKVWEFDKYEYIADEGEEPRYMARTHHDFQREGNPVGYYVPGMEAKTENANTIILGHSTIKDENISNNPLLNDVIYEIDWEGNIIWEWSLNEHIDELKFSDEIRNAIRKNPNIRKAGGGIGDYLHINCMSLLGKNRHYDNGDERFHPDNIIIGSREANTIMIISKHTGKIVWSFGDDIEDEKLKKMGHFIGQHHVHMIPDTLPGRGNIIMFDNGGWAGYGNEDIQCKDGTKKYLRDYSRILEFDPITLEVVYEFSIKNLNLPFPTDASKFYSPYVSSVQRLPNGNTLIDEGFDGRVFEVTPENEIVWEWVSPYFTTKNKKNMIYRAYRYPYEYIKFEEKPVEKPILPINISEFRLENAGKFGAKTVIHVEGTLPYIEESDLCVAVIEEGDEEINKEKLFDIDEDMFKILNSVDDLENVIKSDETSYILFGAPRCKNCKALHEILEEIIEDENLKINLYFVNIDDISEITTKFNIKGIPIFIVTKSGRELSRINGKQDYDELIEFIERYL